MLNFDSWQRCETVKHLINWALPDSGTILDVGGYPGRMRTLLPKHQWFLCDPLVDAPGDQVKGNGDALPFQDASVDYAISLDVFEHIPENKRLAVLDEMRRVAKHGIILSFPHNDPLVTAAEQHVREVYKEIHHKEHPWLSEHSQYPLPDIDTISERLKSYGGDYVIFDVGSLRRWTQLQLISVMLETIPNSLDFARKLDEFYQEHVFIHEFHAPAYRKILLHSFSATEPIELSMVDTTPTEQTQAEIDFQHQIFDGLHQLQKSNKTKIAELQNRVQQLQSEIESQKTKPTDGKAPNDKDSSGKVPSSQTTSLTNVASTSEPIDSESRDEYLSRLETSIRLWEDTQNETLKNLNQAYAWRDQLEQRRSFRLYKRLMRLFGKKISP